MLHAQLHVLATVMRFQCYATFFMLRADVTELDVNHNGRHGVTSLDVAQLRSFRRATVDARVTHVTGRAERLRNDSHLLGELARRHDHQALQDVRSTHVIRTCAVTRWARGWLT